MQKSGHHRQVERPRCPYNLNPMAEEICQNRGLSRQINRSRWRPRHSDHPIRQPANKQRKRDTILPRMLTEATTVKSSHISVTRRMVTPTRMPKTMPSIREDRWGTTSLAPNTPWTRERSRRRAPHPDVDASEHRCKFVAGNPNRKPHREDGSAPSTKRDPPYRPGQWHRQ